MDNPGGISTTSPCTLGTCDFIYGALLCTNLAANDVLVVVYLDPSPKIFFWDNPGDLGTTSPCTLGTCDFIYGALCCTNLQANDVLGVPYLDPSQNNFWITQGALAPHHHVPWAPVIVSMVPCLAQISQLMIYEIPDINIFLLFIICIFAL